ncbi:RsbR, positive regulator of sigma-B [Labilithrix luteola]|uniref:RsbR, positive regulator of sigma-B n=1 Tax=Labilithrix luteola TaxID=1391654 RepID=A0A0K1QDM4_9BACT|nr:STAS domain-containing protein [Labilithrix luteola]AKV03747.1 RsbR, positive regulator of sigma-B [Labilithrix luteola]
MSTTADNVTSGGGDNEYAEELLTKIADVLLIVAGIGDGDYATRLSSDLPPDHPLSSLFQGLNSMMDSLESERRKSESYRRDLEDKIETIDTQKSAIRELSTPIIEVWSGVLCLPIVGVLDSTRAGEMTESLLTAIVSRKARVAIIDITGIQVMDTGTADHFLRMARSVKLLGAQCMLTGINPAIAQTIVHMGVDLSDLLTVRSLRNALQMFVGRTDGTLAH